MVMNVYQNPWRINKWDMLRIGFLDSQSIEFYLCQKAYKYTKQEYIMQYPCIPTNNTITFKK
jgi:hypothetical protein